MNFYKSYNPAMVSAALHRIEEQGFTEEIFSQRPYSGVFGYKDDKNQRQMVF